MSEMNNAEAKKAVGICPVCGSDVVESGKGWFCSNKDWHFGFWKNNAYFSKIGNTLTETMVEELLDKGETQLTGCISQRTGRSYNAMLQMTVDDMERPVFHMEFEKGNKQ